MLHNPILSQSYLLPFPASLLTLQQPRMAMVPRHWVVSCLLGLYLHRSICLAPTYTRHPLLKLKDFNHYTQLKEAFLTSFLVWMRPPTPTAHVLLGQYTMCLRAWGWSSERTGFEFHVFNFQTWVLSSLFNFSEC